MSPIGRNSTPAIGSLGPSGSAEDNMAAIGQAAAQRSADEPGRPGHQDAHQFSTSAVRSRPDWARVRRANALEKCRHQPNLSSAKWQAPISPQGRRPRHHRSAGGAARRPKLLFLVTEDWYFCSHRLPVARAARDAGFAVVVATRVRAHGERIRREGFELRPIAWRRRGDGLVGAVRAISEIARLYRAERPDLLHHVALKPVLFGGVARRLAFPGSADAPAVDRFGHGAWVGLFRCRICRAMCAGRRSLPGCVSRLARGRRWTVVQNPEDRSALVRLGIGRRTSC